MAETTKEEKVYGVFQSISDSYDDANERISLGMDERWRRRIVESVCDSTGPGGKILDVCSGTGDVALAIANARRDVDVTGIDFSPAMLDVARRKGKDVDNVTWREGDAMNLPFEENTFQAATISFGLRNTADYLRVLQEMTRVVIPGGWVYCLDSFVPESPVIRPFYWLYFRYVMPVLGGGWHHRKEYTWLWQSTKQFVTSRELLQLFEEAGLVETEMESPFFGACVFHRGKKRTL